VSAFAVAALLGWGIVAGLDLVSVLQAMVSRPLVSGTVAGAIVGDPVAGVLVGMVLELYALEVLAVGLVTAYVGEWSIVWLRRWNTMRVRQAAAGLDAGDLATVSRQQIRGIGRDALRATLLTCLGLALALAVRRWPPVTGRAVLLLTCVLVGVGFATAATNAARLVGRRHGAWWYLAGLAGGIVWVFLR
jgi:mannose/fructose/N-acetylgalactosamine-specific phosphotransferase system component IIC